MLISEPHCGASCTDRKLEPRMIQALVWNESHKPGGVNFELLFKGWISFGGGMKLEQVYDFGPSSYTAFQSGNSQVGSLKLDYTCTPDSTRRRIFIKRSKLLHIAIWLEEKFYSMHVKCKHELTLFLTGLLTELLPLAPSLPPIHIFNPA